METFRDEWLLLFPPLLLLLVANGAPIVVRSLLGARYAWPLDGGLLFFDGRPLLGPAKSWRGVVAALLVTAMVAPLLGMPWQLGAQFALLVMLGDALSSFFKRRLAIAPRGRATGLDQLPEALLPLLALRQTLELVWGDVLLVVALFVILELSISPILYRLHIRLRPY